MAYYKVCSGCGAALDPGECCEDCRDAAALKKEKDTHQPAKQFGCLRNVPPRRIDKSSLTFAGMSVKSFGEF